jgi:hypothetical protein
MNHTSTKFSKVHTGVSATTSQIAVDWYTGNVYWTDGFYKYVTKFCTRMIHVQVKIFIIVYGISISIQH